MTFYLQIETGLRGHSPRVSSPSNKKRAAVAVVIHPDPDELQVLFIERAAHPNDPWSGHIAFPGGTIEPEDADLRQTAERETREELGFELSCAHYLGQLDDVTGATLPVQVSAYVYAVDHKPDLCPNEEVCALFWSSFRDIIDPDRLKTLQLTNWQPLKEVPAIDLLGPDRPLLWGLTYRIVAQLVGFTGNALPAMV
ncbi:MAG: CoA pyrophosphatase [bacterium]|jgi:8-oxo-dGTP pyrophosphatase MutT (NUDIX family)|nr:CoA pyrophosphatase [bacterium]